MIEQNSEYVKTDFLSSIEPTSELLFSVWEFLDDGICILSDNYTILKVNKSFCDIFGISPNSVLQKNLIDAFSGREKCYNQFKKNIDLYESEPISFHSAIDCSGQRIIIQNTINKLRDYNNNLFYLWIIKDQSDYMKMKETLQDEIEDLRITIKSIGDGVITTGSAGQILYINPEAERLTGWKQFFAEGKYLDEITQTIDENSGEEFEFPLKNILIKGEKIQFSNNTILISRTGNKTPIAYTGSPILNDSGNVKGAAIIIRDETENHLKKKLIQESEARFSSVFHSSLAGIALSTLNDGLFVDVNEKFLETTGYTRKEVIGSTCLQIGLWPDEKLRDHFIELLTEFNRVKEIDFEFRTKSGEIRLGQISAELVKVAGKTFMLSIINDITENKRTAKALSESQQIIKGIINTIPVRVFWKDKNLIYMGCNKIFAQDAGFTDPGEIIGKDDYQMAWSSQAELYRNDDFGVIKSGIPKLNIEEPQNTPEGKVITLLTSKIPLRNNNGEIIGVLGTYIDITERKQVELALRTSEMQLKTALDLAHLGHWEFDVINDVFIFNDNFYKLFHTTAEQEGGYKMSSALYVQRFVHPDDIPFVGKVIQEALDSTQLDIQTELEHKILYADGGTGIIAVRFFVVKDHNGKTVRTYGVNQDITKRKLVEQELKTEKEELNITLRNIRDGVISTNSDDNIILVNKAITDITGWAEEELKGKSIVEFFEIMQADVTSLSGKSNLSTIFGMNENDESVTSEAMEIISKEGSKKIIFLNSAKILNPDNDLNGYVYVIKDITEQVKTETQLQLSQKMESVGQLAAGIAHEINTPIQYIMDNTVFLKDSFNSLDEYFKLTDKLISQSNHSELIKSKREELDLDFLLDEIPSAISQTQMGIERVRKIVSAMKDFSHPSQKEKVMADLNHGIEVTTTISRNEWKYCADLQLNLDKNIPTVFCNIDEINQVVLNMIVNAAHAIQEKTDKSGDNEKGILKISTKFLDDFVIIEISDSGMGIPAEIKEKIFDPFFTTKVVGKGTGQGLAIAHNIIVNNHNGFITVDSKVGQGTTFKIKIPVKESR